MFAFLSSEPFLPLQQSAVYAAAVLACRARVRWPGVTEVTPKEGLAGFGLVPLVTPRHHAIWALGQDLRTGMAGKWWNRRAAAEAAAAGPPLQRAALKPYTCLARSGPADLGMAPGR